MQQLDDIATVKNYVISAGHAALDHDPVPARHLEQKDKGTMRHTLMHNSPEHISADHVVLETHEQHVGAGTGPWIMLISLHTNGSMM